MRLKRSDLSPCPKCKERKGLDWKIWYGGARYLDLYAIECQYCGLRSSSEHTDTKEAMESWNTFVEQFLTQSVASL